MSDILVLMRSIVFYIGYTVTLVPHATFCVLVGWMLPLKKRYRLVVLWNGFTIWWLKLSCGVNYRITGQENVPPGSFVLLSNHQSPWETIFLYDHFQPLCATLKRELLRIPFFGWALGMLKPIAIDRSKPRLARQTLLAEGTQRLGIGISVLVFPEGTRVEPGMERKYSSGGAELAIAAGALVLPVAHNAGTCWPAHRFIKRPGTIDVVIGVPVDATNREARELTEEIRTWIQAAIPQQR